MAFDLENTPPAAVLLGSVIGAALADSAEVDHICGENGNGTWYEVVMACGTLVQVTVEASPTGRAAIG